MGQVQNPKTKIKTRLHQSNFPHKCAFGKQWYLELPFCSYEKSRGKGDIAQSPWKKGDLCLLHKTRTTEA